MRIVNKKIKVFSYEFMLFFALLLLVGFLSYRKAFILDFWADDWTFVYLAKYNLSAYIGKLLYGLHPGELLIAIPFISFFGTNVITWNIWGFVIKVVSSLAVGLGLYGLTKNKLSFYIASLLHVTYFGGIDSYITMSWRTGAYVVILLSLSLYYWGRYSYENAERYFWFSILFFLIALIFDPMRVFFFPLMLYMLGTTMKYVETGKIGSLFLLRNLKLIFVSIFSFLISIRWFSNRISPPGQRIDYILSRIGAWKTFLESLKQFVTSYGVSVSIRGFVFLAFIVFLAGLYLVLKRKLAGPFILFFSMFVPLFFFPNWSFDIGLYSISFRYFTVAGLGIVFLISYLISISPRWLAMILLIGFLVLNIKFSNTTLSAKQEDRSIYFTRPYFEKQAESISEGEEAGLFMIEGDPSIRSKVFDGSSQGALPYAIFNGISDMSRVPFSVTDYESAKPVVCFGGTGAVARERYALTEYPISISKVYAWHINNDGTLSDISDLTRRRLMADAKCGLKNK